MNWKKYPRTKDKVAIVGFSPSTRDGAPFEDEDYEIWSLNEEYRYDWIKRFDRHFQLHPKWDFSRTNNLNDPNHYLWLKNVTDTCTFCKGMGRVKQKENELDCPFCVKGIFTPEGREGKIIYMQRVYKEIPGSVALPYKEFSKKFNPQMSRPYFTSSPAFMLGMAMLLEFPRIELYGFDMGSNTEYHYQRAGFEYWIGLGRGLGYDIYLPPKSLVTTGKLYAYNNMKTSYRQQLEMRKDVLNQNQKVAEANIQTATGRLKMLQELAADRPDLAEYLQTKAKEIDERYRRNLQELGRVEGAIAETLNLTGLYDEFFTEGDRDDAEED